MPHVVFIHLDLGIGGAESLVLNLAKATLPHNSFPDGPSASVSIYTTHCSPSHCYPEVRPPSGPLAPFVRIRGSFLPRSFSLGGTALCSAIRMMYLTYTAARENPNADVFVLDVLPTGIPYLVEVWGVKAGVLFYCHFPDKLLTRDTVNGEQTDGSFEPSGFGRLKRMYRWAMDATEEWTMGFSDLIVVNSKFTMGEVKKVFPSLFLNGKRNNEEVEDGDERVKVLYPAIESSISRKRHNNSTSGSQNGSSQQSRTGPIVSLNRFERKKNIPLLLHAYSLLLERAKLGNLQIKLPPLIIAGGYDPLNTENVEHLAELRVMADQILARFNLSPSIVISSSKSESADQTTEATIAFYPSISNEKRTQFLAEAQVWCYTLHREHFGIVPLEAMDAGVPVVAIRSGGPMETIVDGVTGYLVDYALLDGDVGRNSTVRGFADAIASILLDPQKASEMGQKGRERVHELFGMETFRKQWWEMLYDAKKRGEERYFRNAFSYPRLVYSLLRCLFELLVVCLFAYFITWVLKMIGWIEEDRGILGTVKYHYFKLIEGEEL